MKVEDGVESGTADTAGVSEQSYYANASYAEYFKLTLMICSVLYFAYGQCLWYKTRRWIQHYALDFIFPDGERTSLIIFAFVVASHAFCSIKYMGTFLMVLVVYAVKIFIFNKKIELAFLCAALG